MSASSTCKCSSIGGVNIYGEALRNEVRRGCTSHKDVRVGKSPATQGSVQDWKNTFLESLHLNSPRYAEAVCM